MTFGARALPVLLALLAAGSYAVYPAHADQGSAFSFLGDGNARFSFRYRLESVDQDSLPEDAYASTLRTRLTFETPSERAVKVVLEADNILRLGGANYSDGNRTVTGHPVIADPKGTEINQAFLAVKAQDAAVISLGRQCINLDDQRFVGGVGWRQNEQTYDAARVDVRLPGEIGVDYSFLWNINRIFGPQGGAQAPDWGCNCHVLNVSGQPWSGARLALFVYALDLDDAPALASRTTGIRLSGSRKYSEGIGLDYLFSYADQDDSGANSIDYSASYLHGRLGVERASVKASIGLEVLEGDALTPGAKFVTPLATLHAFNGWADMFLATPDAGLEDLYIRIDAPIAMVAATLVWHRYSAEAGNADYGKEWDFSLSRKFGNKLSVLGKLAAFKSDGFASDTNKFWLMLSYSP